MVAQRAFEHRWTAWKRANRVAAAKRQVTVARTQIAKRPVVRFSR
jgi:hypothetical protein